MKRLFEFLYPILSLLLDGHVGAASRPTSVSSGDMSFESSKRRVDAPEGLPRSISVRQDQPVPAEGELTPDPEPGNTLDLDSLGRLRSFFELLDEWDQKEKGDEK